MLSISQELKIRDPCVLWESFGVDLETIYSNVKAVMLARLLFPLSFAKQNINLQ